jgi:N-acetyl-gamma-glutamyl-phosphate reductase common form
MKINTVILGASGYVGGELLRLIKTHPNFDIVAAISDTYAGEEINNVFPHLAASYHNEVFRSYKNWNKDIDIDDTIAIFNAAPHGISADLLAKTIDELSLDNINTRVVDASADFRFSDPGKFFQTYGIEHPQPELLKQFICGVPEHIDNSNSYFVAHPGCFASAILLALVPIVLEGITDDEFYISAITGSTGSGKSLKKTTHHPERHSNVFAYKPLSHQHAPEVESLLERFSTRKPKINFIPHSGPFSRGIYATVQAKLNINLSTQEISSIYKNYYSDSEFVIYTENSPQLKNVITSNYCHISSTANNGQIVVNCAIDNLIKGSAGGSIQWMNKLWNLPETTGLMSIASPWV